MAGIRHSGLQTNWAIKTFTCVLNSSRRDRRGLFPTFFSKIQIQDDQNKASLSNFTHSTGRQPSFRVTQNNSRADASINKKQLLVAAAEKHFLSILMKFINVTNSTKQFQSHKYTLRLVSDDDRVPFGTFLAHVINDSVKIEMHALRLISAGDHHQSCRALLCLHFRRAIAHTHSQSQLINRRSLLTSPVR